MENRRLLVAALLSALVLILWNIVFPPPAPVRPNPESELTDRTDTGLSQPILAEEPAAREAAQGPGSEQGDADSTEVEQESLGALPELVASLPETVVLENERLRVSIDNRGAQVVSAQLVQHRNAEDGALEMIRRRGSDPFPFALTEGRDQAHPLNRALFVVERSTRSDGAPSVVLRHRSQLGGAQKRFTLTEEGFLEAEVAVEGSSSWGMVFGPGLRQLEEDEVGSRFLRPMATYLRGEEAESLVAAKVKEEEVLLGSGLRWVSLEDNYFLSAAIPLQPLRSVLVRPVLERGLGDDGGARYLPAGSAVEGEELQPELLLLLEPEGSSMALSTFYGAKEYARLAKLPYGLEQTVHWGMFGFLARPLYAGLRWIYERLPNYGWAIVIMTFLIKLVFLPLTHKSQESMRKMQELNPKVQAIRSKYRSKLRDKQGRPNLEAQRQLNEEMMAVYKNAGVNPASGCFPMLLQIPVFFAFFQLLSTAVELRGSPWIGWIKDLAVPDPWYLLPLGMLITSVGMQKMTPPPPDPMQRRMMQLMPIIFVVFSLGFPAGLVLYWVTNNLLTMVQQYVTLKLKSGKGEATPEGNAAKAR